MIKETSEEYEYIYVVFKERSLALNIVMINMREDNNAIKIKVIDAGIGIKEDELSMIFNRFYRASSHRETNKEGSGIGLSIAKVLISNLDGSINVESKYGEGSEFALFIPKNKNRLN